MVRATSRRYVSLPHVGSACTQPTCHTGRVSPRRRPHRASRLASIAVEDHSGRPLLVVVAKALFANTVEARVESKHLLLYGLPRCSRDLARFHSTVLTCVPHTYKCASTHSRRRFVTPFARNSRQPGNSSQGGRWPTALLQWTTRRLPHCSGLASSLLVGPRRS